MTQTIEYQPVIRLEEKPSLAMGIRLRLSAMMFLEFAVWGAWFVVFNVYCDARLHLSGAQVGNLYANVALGAVFSMMFAGQIADKLMPAQYLLAICHLAGAVLLYAMAHVHSYGALWGVTLGYALLYNPTLALTNTVAFANIPDAKRDFPTLRVLGTIGWIFAASAFDLASMLHLPFADGAATTNKPLMFAMGLSVLLGLFSFVLPNTPPRGDTGGGIPFVRALKLLGDPSFGIFFGITLFITIALSFYYTFVGSYLADVGVQKVGATASIGQWSELCFMLALPFALRYLGMKWVMGVGMAAWAIRYVCFSVGHPFALIVLGVALHGVCFDFFIAAGFIYTDEKAPPAIRGSAQALFAFLLYGVGMYLGAIAAGQVKQHYTVGKIVDWFHVWIIPAIGAAVCLALFLLLWKERETPVEAHV